MTDNNTNDSIITAELPDAPTSLPSHLPSKIYLKDYQPPSFNVSRIVLDIRIYHDHALVDSTLSISRNDCITTTEQAATEQAAAEQDHELLLHGRDLQLLSIRLDDQPLTTADYQLDSECLRIANVPDAFILSTQVRITPQNNTTLEGLYEAGSGAQSMYVTQCEPEGFRKITFYPDRPDVLAEFTTRLEADTRYPRLLANGNLLETGTVADDPSRHYAIWHDPTLKPSYLFACVVADLDVLSDRYTTSEGRDVLLELYAKTSDIDKCHVGMQALKDAMHWDEINYGRAYDLDRYMIVAVSQFNMGAMENKGLNIFNTACVLSSPETTTDARSFSVKAVIAHEYFHNWTGNRITCRDWFQLCLKEGFTVFRDQSFSADQQSAAVQRIDDVSTLRAHQFSEDAGPLAHPVRPESFVEINNFYTATVYEKGAEIARMLATLMGKDKFRQGSDEYFRRYDGQAVTVEDFLSAFAVADARALNFIDWYRQPGTPVVSGQQHHDASKQCLHIQLSQHCRHVAGYPKPKPLPIPIATALFDKTSGELLAERLLLLEHAEQTFVFEDIQTDDVVVSLLRDFSAPVILNYAHSDADLAFLLAHENNGFNRWQAAQSLVNPILLKNHPSDVYLSAITQALSDLTNDPERADYMLAARLLDIPSERELATAIATGYDPHAIKIKRQHLKQQLADAFIDQINEGLNPWQRLYEALPITTYSDTPQARGQRALRNVVLDMAMTAGMADAHDWAVSQYQSACCMSERLGALHAMVNHQHPQAQAYLDDFYQRFFGDDLVIDLWFSLQAGSDSVHIDTVKRLLAHADFDWHTPNRVRSVLSSLATQPVPLWSEAGLDVYCQSVAKLDGINPVLASRLLQVLARWYTLPEQPRTMAQHKLQQLKSQVHSKNVLEGLDGILRAAQ